MQDRLNRSGGQTTWLRLWLAGLILFGVQASGSTVTQAQESAVRGDYLYRVTTLRAAPGDLTELIDLLIRQEESGYYVLTRDEPPIIMRHSQGDQWDLMLIYPLESYEEYFDDDRIERREDNREFARTFNERYNGLVAFEEDLFAYGPDVEILRAAFNANGFFHIEMFEALPGLHDELLREREMENDYLVRTGRRPNMIFVGDLGSNVDSFTIGFYDSLQDYAAPTGLSSEETNAAAQAAGFADRDSIGAYLRQFISSHHDTLAVKVR